MTIVKNFNDFKNQRLNEALDIDSIRQVQATGEDVAKWLVKLKHSSKDINDQNAAKDIVNALSRDAAFIKWWGETSTYSGAIKARYQGLIEDKPVMNYNLIAFLHRVKEKDKNLLGQEVAKYEVIFRLYSIHLDGFLSIIFDLTKAAPEVGLTPVGTNPVNLLAWNDTLIENMRFPTVVVAPKPYDKEPEAKKINPAFVFSNKNIAAQIAKLGGNAQGGASATGVSGTQTAGGSTSNTGGGAYTGAANQTGGTIAGAGGTGSGATGSGGSSSSTGAGAGSLNSNAYSGITISNNRLDSVKDLQKRIIAKGGEAANLINSRGADDGKYGTNTAKAVGLILGKPPVNPITDEDSAKLVNLLKDVMITQVTPAAGTPAAGSTKPATKTAVKPKVDPGFIA